MRRRRRGRIVAAAALILTVAAALMLHRGDPGAAPAATTGHHHTGGPDPVTAAVLSVNVIVLIGLAILARLRPPGVRRPGTARAVWRYRQTEPGTPADDRPVAGQETREEAKR